LCQVRASQGNGKANEIRHLRQVRAAVRGWTGCADPPRGSVGGGVIYFDTTRERRLQIFRASKFPHKKFFWFFSTLRDDCSLCRVKFDYVTGKTPRAQHHRVLRKHCTGCAVHDQVDGARGRLPSQWTGRQS
jgi:hypothetical protein